MFGDDHKQQAIEPRRGNRHLGKLRINTQIASNGNSVPYESRVQQLSFVSFEESKARKNANIAKKSIRDRLGGLTPVRSGPKQVVPQLQGSTGSVRSTKAAIVATTPAAPTHQDGLAPPPSSRAKGVRPEPLKLNQDISPSDRAIPIGISLLASSASNDATPHSASSWDCSPAVADREVGPSRGAHDVNTPMIVITPAKDRFSPTEGRELNHHRPASSIYSRYTNCYPKFAEVTATPPVPPVPLFMNDVKLKSHFSSFTRESVGTTFEEDAETSRESATQLGGEQYDRYSKRSTAGLPTPRRSKGWWNIITSPFSAKSTGAGAFFWRSPSTPEQDADCVPVLRNAAAMAQSNTHEGVIFLDRASGDGELRSAPAACSDEAPRERASDATPKRSNTAPGAIDANNSVINIYSIPKAGEAAAYYDPNRHFPSLHLGNDDTLSDTLRGWSPSQSVFMPERSAVSTPATIAHTPTVMEAALEAEEIFTVDHGGPATAASPTARTLMFSTPSAAELKTPPTTVAAANPSGAQNTMDATMSPLSATPKLHDAHVARFMGPQKTVDMEGGPAATGPGLAAATMAHSREENMKHDEQAHTRPAHVRQDSHGLGISSEEEIFPPPPPPVHLSEKPRLGTDRYGQLTLRSWDEQNPSQPWYRRFFWFLATGLGIAVVLLMVLLVIFLPQRHDDMSVQASWLNLTAFPALAIGVSTVIRPKNTLSTSSCVSPSALWSCAAPGQPDNSLPDFRFEIRFRNGTLPKNETTPAASTTVKRWQDSSRSHQFVRRSLWSDSLYNTYPSPPSHNDQLFMGRTTDNTSEPYNGEETPFYISLLDTATMPNPKLHKRDSTWSYPYPTATYTASASPDATSTASTESSSNASTSSADDIPAPDVNSEGQPADQILYPLVSAQPLRLFNRGQDSEHYGFYSYFARTIYTSGSSDMSQLSSTNITSNVALDEASAVCTFSQTRLRIQIWTKRGIVSALNTTNGSVAASNSSANDMDAPGSFPLPVTITLDRHGGEADRKGVYCYGLNDKHRAMSDVKTWVYEHRGSSLVNPADVPGSNSTGVERRDEDDEGTGIDGGSGGCDCQYQNWNP